MADNTVPFDNSQNSNQGNSGNGSTPPPQNTFQSNPQPVPPSSNPMGGGQPIPANQNPQNAGQGAVNPYNPPPMGNPPAAGQGGMPTPPPPPPEDNTPANFQIGTKLPQVIGIKIPAHSLQFDEQHFLHLLAGSISLTKDEKKRIIDSIPKLKQSQVDELIRIFEEERRKFAELSAKHVEQLKKLDQQHFLEWQALELEQKASEKKNQDQAQADEIRKKLGL